MSEKQDQLTVYCIHEFRVICVLFSWISLCCTCM